MSILRWLKKKKGLIMKKTIEKHAVVASANDEVGHVKAVSKKRGKHTSYDECIPAKMGRFASQHGTAAAVKILSVVNWEAAKTRN